MSELHSVIRVIGFIGKFPREGGIKKTNCMGGQATNDVKKSVSENNKQKALK